MSVETLKIVVDGNEVEIPIDNPELKKHVEESVKASVKTEKDKLYGKNAELKTRNTELTKENASLQEKVNELQGQLTTTQTELQTRTTDPNAAASAKPEGEGSDLDTKIATLVSKEVQKVVGPIATQLDGIANAFTKQERSGIAEYREKVIAENAGTIIPELVQGNTKEEIDASLLVAKDVRARYPESSAAPAPAAAAPAPPQAAAPAAAPGTPQAAPATPAAQAPPAAPAVPATPADRRPSAIQTPNDQPNVPNIKNMTMEEFARRRSELESNIKSLVPNPSLEQAVQSPNSL